MEIEWDDLRIRLFESGWTFWPDMTHPVSQKLGYYVAHLNDGAYGWYINPAYPLKSQPAGDSHPRWMAGKMVARFATL